MAERDPKTGRFPKGNGRGSGNWASGPANGVGAPPIDGGPEGDRIRALRWDPDNLAQKEEVAAEMRAVWYNIAKFDENSMARIAAADKLMARLDPAPTRVDMNANITIPDNRTAEEIKRDIAALAATVGVALPDDGSEGPAEA